MVFAMSREAQPMPPGSSWELWLWGISVEVEILTKPVLVGLEHEFYDFPIIPTDSHFSEGVGIPPTRIHSLELVKTQLNILVFKLSFWNQLSQLTKSEYFGQLHPEPGHHTVSISSATECCRAWWNWPGLLAQSFEISMRSNLMFKNSTPIFCWLKND